jgi:hypothetical protein
MKTIKVFTILSATALFLITISCKKGKSDCYDEQLYQQCKNSTCTADCPIVTGCDGKTYCNECEANRQGIRVKK